MVRLFYPKTEVGGGINIIVLGSICLLIATFLHDIFYINSNSIPIFIICGLCFILSGSIIILRNFSVFVEHVKDPRKEKFLFIRLLSYHVIGSYHILTSFINAFFHVGILLLITGTMYMLLFDFLPKFPNFDLIPIIIVFFIALFYFLLRPVEIE